MLKLNVLLGKLCCTNGVLYFGWGLLLLRLLMLLLMLMLVLPMNHGCNWYGAVFLDRKTYNQQKRHDVVMCQEDRHLSYFFRLGQVWLVAGFGALFPSKPLNQESIVIPCFLWVFPHHGMIE